MVTGSCLCGGVKLELRGELRSVVNCHCSQCLKTHGNFAAYSAVHKSDLHYIRRDSLKWFQSSDSAQRGFCDQCGASILWSRNDQETISVSAGILDQPCGLTTTSEIFVASKGDYYEITSGLPCRAGSGR